MSVLGFMVVKRIEDKHHFYFYDVVIKNHIQDSFQVMSCIEAALKQIFCDHPAESGFIVSDNASVFSKDIMALFVFLATKEENQWRITDWVNTEAQTGSDMLDTHFS